MLQVIKTAFHHSVIYSWLITSGLIFTLFCVIFYGIDEITSRREDLHHLYFQWELQIPYLPYMFIFYASVLLLPFLLPFTVSSPVQIKRWGIEMSISILIAGICFLIMPATLGYDFSNIPSWINLNLVRALTGSYNLVPSLHVALSLVTINAMWPGLKNRWRLLLIAWGIAMSLSTLFTHQHHLLDVLSGLALGWIVVVWCRRIIHIKEAI